ncbi:hypothetical protein [Spongiivirga citrea]|uniref:Uncharacterized protein n=1 Tax=Spongiivirga citrea TaxID=1481457 RepID=A0A6M0CU75_9FLAO|nr:hypothetical protein [Spongiivirga citrea]NER17320.1 hypothetical protein [Spongiivirga citrea]
MKIKMINPVTFFYSKIYTYITYAGITEVNPHLQSSLIVTATLCYYLQQAINLLPFELNPTAQLITLLLCPLSLFICYTYYNNDGREKQLERLNLNENEDERSLNNALTIALVVPMLVFFTVTVFNL